MSSFGRDGLRRIVRDRWASRAARLVVVAIGIWLMAAPSVLGYEDTGASDSDRIIGPIAGSVAFVALWDILVPLRWLLGPCGVWLLAAPIVLDAGNTAWVVSTVISGVIIVLSVPFGPDIRPRFDGGWRSVRPSRWVPPNES